MSDHVVPMRVYYGVFAALLTLTWLTVAASRYDFGSVTLLGTGAVIPVNLMVALAIAIAKASLVVLFFMHLRWSAPLLGVVAGAGIVWLGILLLLTFSDYWSRGWLGSPGT